MRVAVSAGLVSRALALLQQNFDKDDRAMNELRNFPLFSSVGPINDAVALFTEAEQLDTASSKMTANLPGCPYKFPLLHASYGIFLVSSQPTQSLIFALAYSPTFTSRYR
jgi:hypothetical protein